MSHVWNLNEVCFFIDFMHFLYSFGKLRRGCRPIKEFMKDEIDVRRYEV